MGSKLSIDFEEERKRDVKLTGFISITISIILATISFVYYLSDTLESKQLYTLLLISSGIFLLPYLLIKRGQVHTSRFILSILLPIAITAMSITSKIEVIEMNVINPVNYFDVRIALINAVIIPIVIYSLRESRWLFFSLIPALICMLLFDPIHEAFGVGYYDSGLTSKDYYFTANLFSAITVFFLVSVMFFLKYQVLNSDHRQLSENSKIKMYLSKMMQLSNSSNINNGEIDLAKQEIIKAAQECLKVSRASIWSYQQSTDSITCEYLIEKSLIDCPNTELKAVDYPKYFAALQNQELIIAPDAVNDAVTAEFTYNYLKPLSIYSMMDAPYTVKGKFGGVICCEHQNEIKEWDAIESLFLKALGDFLSYTIVVNERIKQNELLKEKNAEISTINENLEAIVKTRTVELEKKNEQLTEYAYINSHVLRAPVARISGLHNLFKLQSVNTKQEDSDLILHFTNSISELEKVTFQINRAIEEHGNINRSQFEQ